MPFMGNVQLPTIAGGSGTSSSSLPAPAGEPLPYPFARDTWCISSSGGLIGGATATDAGRLASPGGGGGGAKAVPAGLGLSPVGSAGGGRAAPPAGGGGGGGGTIRPVADAPLEARDLPALCIARAAGLMPVGSGGASPSSSLSCWYPEAVRDGRAGGRLRLGRGGADSEETELEEGLEGSAGGGGARVLEGMGGAAGGSVRAGDPVEDGTRVGREGGPVGLGGGGGARCASSATLDACCVRSFRNLQGALRDRQAEEVAVVG